MANYLISGSFALVSAFVGMFLPMVSTVGPIQMPTNLLLGFVYGLGWFVGGFLDDVRSRHVETFGSIIWPVVVILMVNIFSGDCFRTIVTGDSLSFFVVSSSCS